MNMGAWGMHMLNSLDQELEMTVNCLTGHAGN